MPRLERAAKGVDFEEGGDLLAPCPRMPDCEHGGSQREFCPTMRRQWCFREQQKGSAVAAHMSEDSHSVFAASASRMFIQLLQKTRSARDSAGRGSLRKTKTYIANPAKIASAFGSLLTSAVATPASTAAIAAPPNTRNYSVTRGRIHAHQRLTGAQHLFRRSFHAAHAAVQVNHPKGPRGT